MEFRYSTYWLDILRGKFQCQYNWNCWNHDQQVGALKFDIIYLVENVTTSAFFDVKAFNASISISNSITNAITNTIN